MATADLTLVLKARDEAQKAIRDLNSALGDVDTHANKASGSLGKLHDVLGGLGKAAAVGAAVGVAAIAGLGVAAVKMASDFEGGMREVNTMMGLSEGGLKDLSGKVTDLSMSLGVDAVASTKALYQAISAGVPADNALTFLEIATKAAIGGVTDTETAVDGLTTVVNAFGMGADAAQSVADIMFTTVKQGKTTFSELSASMSTVAPMAASAGVGFGEVSAMVATLTKQGVPTAQAMTQIRAAMQGLLKPSDEMSAIFGKLGYESAGAAIKAKGLQFALAAVAEATGGDIGAMSGLLGSVEAVGAALGTTGKNADMFRGDLAAMDGAAGASQAAFEEMNKGFGRSMEKLKSAFSGIMIMIGSEILPHITPVVQAIAERLPGAFKELKEKVGPIIAEIGTIIGGLATSVQTLVSGLQTGDFTAFIESFEKLTGLDISVFRVATDAIKTFISALQGKWEPSPGIMQIHDIVGRIGLALRDAGLAVGDFAKKLGDVAGGTLLTVLPQIAGAAAFLGTVALPIAVGALQLLIAGFTGLMGIAGAVVGFFAQNQGAATALGVVIGANLIPKLALLVVSFAAATAATIVHSAVSLGQGIAAFIGPSIAALTLAGNLIIVSGQLLLTAGKYAILGAAAIATTIAHVGLVGALGIVAAAALGAVAAIPALILGFAGWAASAIAAGIATVAAMLPVLIPIALAVAAVGALYLAWTQNWGGIREIVGAVVGFIVEKIGAVMGWLGDMAAKVGIVGPDWRKGWDDLKASATSAADGAKIGVTGALSGMKDGGLSSIMGLKTTGSTDMAALQAQIIASMQAAQIGGVAAAVGLQTNAGTAISTLSTEAQITLRALETNGTDALQTLDANGVAALRALDLDGLNWMRDLQTAGTVAITGLQTGGSTQAATLAANGIASLADLDKQGVASAADLAKQGSQSFMDFKGKASEMDTAFGGAANHMSEVSERLAGNIMRDIGAAARAVYLAAQNMIASFAAIPKRIDIEIITHHITEYETRGLPPAEMPGLPEFALGGITRQAQIAMLHANEAIIPLVRVPTGLRSLITALATGQAGGGIVPGGGGQTGGGIVPTGGQGGGVGGALGGGQGSGGAIPRTGPGMGGGQGTGSRIGPGHGWGIPGGLPIIPGGGGGQGSGGRIGGGGGPWDFTQGNFGPLQAAQGTIAWARATRDRLVQEMAESAMTEANRVAGMSDSRGQMGGIWGGSSWTGRPDATKAAGASQYQAPPDRSVTIHITAPHLRGDSDLITWIRSQLTTVARESGDALGGLA